MGTEEREEGTIHRQGKVRREDEATRRNGEVCEACAEHEDSHGEGVWQELL